MSSKLQSALAELKKHGALGVPSSLTVDGAKNGASWRGRKKDGSSWSLIKNNESSFSCSC